MNFISKTAILLVLGFVVACSGGSGEKQKKQKHEPKTEETKTGQTTSEEPKNDKLNVMYGEGKGHLKAYYELEHLKEFYRFGDYTDLPPLKYPEDLSSLSYEDLRLLRNEIFARNGYLFGDGFLRGYFNRFKWYKPIFDVDSFKVILNKEEQKLVKEIQAEEKRRKANKMVERGGIQLYNSHMVVNKKQFANLPERYMEDFSKQNFSIVPTKRSMPFFSYDDNAYQYIPHYITTDLYLFILHKYFSCTIEKLDENYMQPQLKKILQKTKESLTQLAEENAGTDLTDAIEWAQMYTAIALHAIGDTEASVPATYQEMFNKEKAQIDAMNGKPIFIPNQLQNYNELKPRGHYSKNDTLKKYFRCFKWISLNGADMNKPKELKGFLAFAQALKNSEEAFGDYNAYVETIEKLAGKEDNLSLMDVVNSISSNSLAETLSEENLSNLKAKLAASNKEKIKTVFGAHFKTPERDAKRLVFLSATYSVSGDIFSKLVHIDGVNSKRPFPKGLDLPAVFKNKTAEDILFNEYKEQETWEEYKPKLTALQQQFENYAIWDTNYGSKGLQTALSAFGERDNYPGFMKTDAYNRKELSTALSSWTHIKHDLILYQEKPHAAEAGQGGGPEPPNHYSYVEPNVEFWESALELVDWLEKLSSKEATFKHQLQSIKELGQRLLTVSKKELNGEAISIEEHQTLHYIGGTIEYLLFALLETDHLPERERSMALIADVYLYNNQNLNVAVGNADDIYVVVPIKGEYHIARGSVFSYYEFEGKIHTDEEWKARVAKGQTPARPEWLAPLISNENPLEGQMQYRY